VLHDDCLVVIRDAGDVRLLSNKPIDQFEGSNYTLKMLPINHFTYFVQQQLVKVISC